MKQIKIRQVISIEEFPSQFQNEIWEELPKNGGNVVLFDSETAVGKWLISQGYVFDNKYVDIIVYR